MKIYWKSFKKVMKIYWKSIENLLKTYWKSIENLLKINWKFIENLLKRDRTYRHTLHNVWDRFGTVLGPFWDRFGTVLGAPFWVLNFPKICEKPWKNIVFSMLFSDFREIKDPKRSSPKQSQNGAKRYVKYVCMYGPFSIDFQ